MTKVWSLLAIGAIATTPRRAVAETAPLPLELRWDAPEGCPSSSFVRRRIEQIVRGPQTAPTRAEAKVEGGAHGRLKVTLIVRTGDVEEHRTVEAASCSALAEAFAVVVAYVIDPSSDAARIDEAGSAEELFGPQGPGAPLAPAEAPPSAAPPNVGQAEKTPRPHAPPSGPPATQFAFGLGASVASGPLPQASTGVVATAALRLHRLRVGALGTISSRQRQYFDGPAGASFDMIDVGAFAGYMVPLGVFALGPCANIEATYVQLQGFGIRRPWTSSGGWLTAVLGARVEARVARWLGLYARTDLLLPVGAPSFILATRNDDVRLHDPAALALRMSLGAEFVIP